REQYREHDHANRIAECAGVVDWHKDRSRSGWETRKHRRGHTAGLPRTIGKASAGTEPGDRPFCSAQWRGLGGTEYSGSRHGELTGMSKAAPEIHVRKAHTIKLPAIYTVETIAAGKVTIAKFPVNTE